MYTVVMIKAFVTQHTTPPHSSPLGLPRSCVLLPAGLLQQLLSCMDRLLQCPDLSCLLHSPADSPGLEPLGQLQGVLTWWGVAGHASSTSVPPQRGVHILKVGGLGFRVSKPGV